MKNHSYYYSWEDCLQWIVQEAGLEEFEQSFFASSLSLLSSPSSSSSTTTSPGCYNVQLWWSYLDAIEEHSLKQEQKLQQKQQKQPQLKKQSEEEDSSKISPGEAAMDWIFRRALSHLPRSYKLWKRYWEYLLQLEKKEKNKNTTEGTLLLLLPRALDRALWTCHKFPRVWIVYWEFLTRHATYQSITATRRLANKCLQALPISQHTKVWPYMLQALAAVPNLPLETQSRILEHQVLLDPSLYRRDYGDFLVQHEQWGAAAHVYLQLLNNSSGGGTTTGSSTGSSSSTGNDDTATTMTMVVVDASSLWRELVRLCAQHPHEVTAAIPSWERILASQLVVVLQPPSREDGGGIGKKRLQNHADSNNTAAGGAGAGQLWSWWAESYVRRGNFDMARSLYERGMQHVSTVQDFTVVYNAYLQMEEELLEAIAESASAGATNDNGDDDATNTATSTNEWDILLDEGSGSGNSDSSACAAQVWNLEWALARAEHLTKRRPLWLNRVVLRQNPNNVGEWLKRAALLGEGGSSTSSFSGGGGRQATEALEEALRVIQANQAVNGSLTQVVSMLLQRYEAGRRYDQARDLMDRICNQGLYRFRTADDLAECWTYSIELELRQEAWDDALALVRQAVAAAPPPPPKKSTTGSSTGRQWNLSRSLRLWDLRLDLEESLGTAQTTKDAYNRALAIKAATVQHVLNYCAFLTEHKYFEESFTVFERGLELFPFPHQGAKLLWKEYLQSFLNRYEGTKVERVRDMFQRCLETCPAEECAEFFIMNAEFEEKHGLTKRALGVYQSMCDDVPKEEKLMAYKLFIAKTTKYLGLTATREIYQDALDKLDDKSAATLCLDFMRTETTLQQIDRARGVLTYGAQMADPRRMPEYWKAWNEFEIAHGNEETFRDMLRVKRSVEAAFSTVNYNASGMGDAVERPLTDAEAIQMIANQEGVDIEQDQQRPKTSVAGFVPSRSSKRTAAAANLEDVEERVAKLRKAASEAFGKEDDAADSGGEDNEEIDIDDIDAEIEEAAAEGAAAVAEAASTSVREVSTKTVPAAVFGALASAANESKAEDSTS